MCKKKSISLSHWLIPSFSAIVGVVAGLIATLLTTSYVEERKLTKQRQSEAVAAYLEVAWGGSSERESLEFYRKLSLLSVYAPESVLEKIRAYGESGCAEAHDELPDCKSLWVSIVTELRSFVGSKEVSEDSIESLLWGK